MALRHVFRLAAVLTLACGAALAEDVQIRHQGLRLNGNLETTGGQMPAEGLVLIAHGTLAHHRMEIIEVLQRQLKERGLASLAVTLSLGIDDRRGMYDCQVPHRHRYVDALDEYAAWIAWAQSRGARRLVLAGHSRGGAQVGWYASERADHTIAKVVLIAPTLWDGAQAAREFERTHARPLDDALAQARSRVEAGRGQDILPRPGYLTCTDTQVSADTFWDYYRDEPRRDTAYLLPRIAAPVLVVAAGGDEVVKGLPERVRPLADGRRVRLAVIDAADHFFRDLFADEMADAVAAFVTD
jgi:pimeloyl-ACP methyl ester carboxylesterase